MDHSRAEVPRRTLLGLLTAGVASLVAACSRGGGKAVPDGATTVAYRYGGHDQQVADLWLPAVPTPGSSPVVMIHGGYWKSGYDRTLQDAVAADLVGRGIPVWNIDYRPAPDAGWPGTFEDVAAAMDLLAEAAGEHDLGVDAVVVIGHSAGGTLSLWASARHRLPAGAPGADPVVRPVAAVSQAGINDLVAGAEADLGAGAVAALMGGLPSQVGDDRYAWASPTELLPTDVPQLVITGQDDTVVPIEQSLNYAESGGDPVTLEVVEGEDHFGHVEADSEVWRFTRDWIQPHRR